MSAYGSDDNASETLEPIKYRYTPPASPIPQITRASSSSPETVESRGSKLSKTSKESPPRRKKQKRKKVKINHGQGDVVLFRYFAPDNPELVKGAGNRTFDLGSSGESEPEESMDGTAQGPVAAAPIGYPPRTGLPSNGIVGAVSAVVAGATIIMNSAALKRPHNEVRDASSDVNSLGRSVSGSFLEMDKRRLFQQKPLTLSTSTSDPTVRMRDAAAADGLLQLKRDSPRRRSSTQDSIATSPLLQQHLISPSEGGAGPTLPAMTAESPRGVEASLTSKQDINLPPLSHLIEETSMASERPRTSSYSSVSTMPGMSPATGTRVLPQPLQSPFQPGNPLSRTSTGGSHESRSPVMALGESPQEISGIVPDRRPYHQRRVPMRSTDSIPPMLSNQKDTSNSSRSFANAAANTSTSTNTSTDAYSPEAGPTPSDIVTSGDDTPQSSTGASGRYLHYPSVPIGGYKCQHEGCDAPPFSTQYLLNSHANVHSQDRPHFCPVQGCLRSKGGKGFKRKNEMIRHGLVHQSPGYVCPWCPDREHRYPRPDNLQRHVRMHHDDKDKDDPKLVEVLSLRAVGGTSRGRKRRNA